MIFIRKHEDMKKLLKYAPGYSYADPDDDVYLIYAYRNQNWHAMSCSKAEYESLSSDHFTIELDEPIIEHRRD